MSNLICCEECVFETENRCHLNPPTPIAVRAGLHESDFTRPFVFGDDFCSHGQAKPEHIETQPKPTSSRKRGRTNR